MYIKNSQGDGEGAVGDDSEGCSSSEEEMQIPEKKKQQQVEGI